MMPLPEFLLSANLIVCEKVLAEKDDVVSAIRIVDVFAVPPPPKEVENLKEGDSIPSDAPIVRPWMIISLIAVPGYAATHRFSLKLLNTRSELVDIGDPMDVTFSGKFPEGHTAAGIITQISLVVRSFGVCCVRAYLNETEVARVSITFTPARQPSAAA